MICNTIITEREHVIALDQICRVGRIDSLPRLAAVKRDVVVTAGAWFWRTARLERRRDHVVGVIRVDRDGDFSRIYRVGISDANDLLGVGCHGKEGE